MIKRKEDAGEKITPGYRSFPTADELPKTCYEGNDLDKLLLAFTTMQGALIEVAAYLERISTRGSAAALVPIRAALALADKVTHDAD